jgi:hypothetical protein
MALKSTSSAARIAIVPSFREFIFFSFLFINEMLDGWAAAGNRDQGQIEIANALEQALECGLVGQRAGKQGLIPFQVYQL